MFLISVYEDKTFPKRSLCQKCMSWIRQHLAKVQQEVSKHGSQWPQRQATWCRWKHYLEQKLLEGRIRYGSVKFGLCFTCKSETFHRNTAPFDVIFLYMVDIWYYFIHTGITPVQDFVKPRRFVEIRDAIDIPASLCHTGALLNQVHMTWQFEFVASSPQVFWLPVHPGGSPSICWRQKMASLLSELTVVMVIDMKQTLSFFLFQTLPFLVCPNVLFFSSKMRRKQVRVDVTTKLCAQEMYRDSEDFKILTREAWHKRSQTFTRLVSSLPPTGKAHEKWLSYLREDTE